MQILLALVLLVLQTRNVPGVLDKPDPKQMESAPPLGYQPVETALTLPDGVKLGASSGVAFDAQGHMWVLNRGEHPLMEFDANGRLLRTLGEGKYNRAHGLRIAPDGSIWTTDVQGHTVMKMNTRGEVELTLGTRGQPGSWDEAAGTRLLYEPANLAFAPNGDVLVVQGHGRGEGRVLRFSRNGTFIRSWGGKGSGPRQFDQPHSILVTPDNRVLVADRENHRVQIFNLDGTYIKEWKFNGLPCGLLMGPDKQLYLATGFSGQILRLDANGKAVAMMGEPGPGPALGAFGEAHYMAIAPNTDIYVADTINAKLHRFARRPS
ncbi:MAG: peptidyl-alpha-hydroxyglycine alpha-amidating lyase family protein [Vicinamibacterales bacterium]